MNLTEKEISQLIEKLGGEDHTRKVITGENVVKLFPSEYFVVPDRTLIPKYHRNFKVKLVYPELESEGPPFFSMDQLELWTHEDQSKKSSLDGDGMRGINLSGEIVRLKKLERCLNIQDGYAILEKGVNLYHKLFGYKFLMLWKSLFRDEKGDYYVPFIGPTHSSGFVVTSEWIGDYRFNICLNLNYVTPLFKF